MTDAPASRQAPDDSDGARERLRKAAIPHEILGVARRLSEAGHAVVVVGGAVRDFLLGIDHDDWDLASSATPHEVLGLFEKTIPTGIQHGTVTVLAGRGSRRAPVEITTFRGEGVYEDGRRPTEVRFLRELHEDLARRDFTINAFAWDPVGEVFSDHFGGLADLQSGTVRAVGTPLERFREDGLRTMRAVRFCATLGFSLDAETLAAIGGALDVFDLVSRERVRVELFKLLKARRPSLGLTPMASTGLWPRVLADLDDEQKMQSIAAVDRMSPDPVARLARLLRSESIDAKRVAEVLDQLKPSRDERARVLALTGPQVRSLHTADSAQDVRRAVAGLGRPLLDGALEVLAVDGTRRAEVFEALAGAALSVKELAVTGGELIKEDIVERGPQVGALLVRLLDRCLADPGLNDPEKLREVARSLV